MFARWLGVAFPFTPKVNAGEICALFGVDCNSGDTFTAGRSKVLKSLALTDRW